MSNSARSRTNSITSSVQSVTNTNSLFGNYSSPQRQYNPPSDVESEIDVDDFTNNSQSSSPNSNADTKKLHTLLNIYKSKFNQLRDAYNEVENEKEKIKVNISKYAKSALTFVNFMHTDRKY